MVNYEAARARMIRRQLSARDISDRRVLAAMASVSRERFVDESLATSAYDDRPLPIGAGQTISQPYIVALTAEALRLVGRERVLEVGTGSGYAAAVLSLLAREVYTIERVDNLAERASTRLRELGFDNVHARAGDGSLGWPEHAPYQAIAVAAVGPDAPRALLEQLDIGGRLVMPIGPDGEQTLVRLTRASADRYEREPLMDVRFVPLIGAQGFSSRERVSGH